MEHTWAQEAATPETLFPDVGSFTQSKRGKWFCPICPQSNWGKNWPKNHSEEIHYKCPDCGDYFVSLGSHRWSCVGKE